jgi:hypothetical protein
MADCEQKREARHEATYANNSFTPCSAALYCMNASAQWQDRPRNEGGGAASPNDKR